jgi:phospholipase/carboxylesterase
MDTDLLVQRPPGASRLLLLFHGVGSNAADLVPLGRALAPYLPDTVVASVQAPDASGPGWQWFAVHDVSEANRPARVAQAMPAFLLAVQRWQATTGVDAPRTTLLGFSQGAIMALESTQLEQGPACGCVVAIAGRFAQGPSRAPAGTRIHLLQGETDPVMPARLAVDAAAKLRALGGQVTLDLFPGLGHGIDRRVLEKVLERLREDASA